MGLIRRCSPGLFFILAYLITWTLWVPAALTKLNGGTPVLGPDSPVGQLGRWAPGLAAVLLTALLDGRAGLRELFRPLGYWRVHARWYALALFVQPALLFAGRWLDDLLGRAQPVVSPLDSVSGPLAFVIPVMIVLALPGSFAEELGWRGFALPALQSRWNAVLASVILALLWGTWHVPTWLYAGQTGAFGLLLAVVSFIPVTILFTWLYNHTGGSLLLVTLLHLSQQLTFAFWGMPSRTGDALMWLVAAVLVITYGTRLRRRSLTAAPPAVDRPIHG